MIKGRSLLALSTLIIGLSCDGPERATGIRGLPDASEIIADGAHGGNPDFFFLPPMVPPPFQHPDFERGKFNPRLQASLRIEICELAREPVDLALPVTRPKTTTACAAKPLIEEFLPGSVDLVGMPSQQTGWWSNFNLPADGFYKALWDTRQENLSLDKYYRIKVLIDGSDTPLGYADVDPVSNMKEWKHVMTGEVVTMIDDTKLPIAFRVETGALCPPGTQCGSATITNDNPNGDNQVLQVLTENGIPVAGVLIPDNWLPPDGPQSVVISISRVNTGVKNVPAGTQEFPCHANLPLQQFDGCFNFRTIPELPVIDEETGRQFATPIIAAVCFSLADSEDPREPYVQLWKSEPEDEGDQAIPLKSADASLVLTDHEGHNCAEQPVVSSSSNPLLRVASAGWQKFAKGFGKVFGVKTAYAVDLGIGGILDSFSNVGPALSAQIQPYTSTELILGPGAATTATARVVGTQKHDGSSLNTGIGGVAVTYTVAPGNGSLNALGTTGGAATEVTVTTNVNPIDPESPTSGGGFAPVNWTLPTAPGTYTLTATSRARGGPVTFSATVPEPLASPVLVFTGTQTIQLAAGSIVQHNLTVTNYESYPASMFVALADPAGPCAETANASRIRAEVYDAANDVLLQRLCFLGSPSALQALFFRRLSSTPAPEGVYVKLVDRATGSTSTSNTVIPFAAPVGAVAARAPMPAPLHSHAVAVVDGTLYALGGVSAGITSEIRAYNPVLNSWSSVGNLLQTRSNHGTAVIGGVIYSVGGLSSSDPSSNSATVETFTPATGARGSIPDMPGARAAAGVAAVNGILYVIGGSSFNINSVATVLAYDPVEGTWSTRSPMPQPRNNLATAVVNGIIYAIGGRDFRANTGQFGTLSEVYAYNPATDTWTGPLAPMPNPSKAMSVGVINGRIYVAGGIGEGIGLPNVDAYDPVQNVWIPQAPLAAGRGLTSGGVVNGVFYVLGGFLAGGGVVATNEAFTP